MKITLNVYTDRKLKTIEKTYDAEDVCLSLGVVEDVMQYINLDIFEGGFEALSDEGRIGEVVRMVVGAYSTFKGLLKDVFDGITDEELERTNIVEVAKAVIDIVKSGVSMLGGAVGFNKRKN